MKNNLLTAIVIAVIAATVAFMAYTARQQARRTGASGHKIVVVTTLFPLYDMAKHIGADKADVSLLLPPGVEPHSFDPTPGDVVRINEADVFVYAGKFMEPWADKIIKSITNKNLIVVDASQGTRMIPAVFHDIDEPAGALDPHIWLDFDNARIMVQNIEKALEAKDPADSGFSQRNAEAYSKGLTEIDQSFKNTLAHCRDREIVYGGHYAFGYLAKRYGLKYLAAQGVSPNAEPTAKDLARLVDQIKKDKIRYVFYEELTSPKIAETIAGETKAQMLLLNPAANVTRNQLEQGVTFFGILKADLENLKTGLECQ